MTRRPRMMVIGLDCAPPRLVFEDWRDHLPHLNRLLSQGISGPLRSVDPPITVPAWMSMVTGCDPGQLGLYGFRNRRDHSYDDLEVSDSRHLTRPTVWDLLGERNYQSICIGVPLTYPTRPIRGIQVSCFLTPDVSCNYTWPRIIRRDLERLTGGYMLDVKDFRTRHPQEVLDDIWEMTRRRFRVVQDFAVTRPWDFFMFVEMGVDRIHHGFWRYMDPAHPGHIPNHPLQDAILNYYRFVDGEIGKLLDVLPPDTAVLVVSDHGARAMQGGICVNEVLIRAGLLQLNTYPDSIQRLTPDKVQWDATTAWGEGGYYARIFLNVQGREPRGTIPPERYEEARSAVEAVLTAVPHRSGAPLRTRVLRPEALYREVNGVPPDLLVYFGELDWRSIGTVGHNDIHTATNDQGSDDANHDMDGIYILNRPGYQGPPQSARPRHLLDVAPTVLDHFGIDAPQGLVGRPIL